MKNEGKVLKTDENIATIAVKRESACGHSCKECAGCGASGLAVTRAKNEIGARAGDDVLFEESTAGVLTKAFLLYIVPILCFLAGYFIALSFSLTEQNALLSGGALFLLSFIPVKILDVRADKREKLPVITKIISTEAAEKS